MQMYAVIHVALLVQILYSGLSKVVVIRSVYIETTAMNPQFHVAIPRTSNNKCHVVVSVTQHYETLPEAKINKQLQAIGFAVYEVPHSMPRLTKQFVSENVIN